MVIQLIGCGAPALPQRRQHPHFILLFYREAEPEWPTRGKYEYALPLWCDFGIV